MAEYINREEVYYQLAKQATIDNQPRAIRRAAKIVMEFPSADVRPTVRGEWLTITEYEGEGKKRKEATHYCICSVCKETATAGSSFWDNKTPFCPWCGAEMLEDTTEDTIEDTADV